MAIEVAENITWKNLSTGVVLLNLDSGEYFTLNETASAIWKGLIENQNDQQIVESLVAEFDCDEVQAKEDLNEYLAFLTSEKLIVSNAE